MNYLVLLLRFVHIVAGIFWVGGSLLTTFFIVPASAANAEAGRSFMSHLMQRGRMMQAFSAAAGLTGLAGLGLYWVDSRGLTSTWMHSAAGIGFGLGAVFGLLGFVFGAQAGLAARQVGRLASAVRGQPTQGQILELDSAQRRLYRLGLARDVLLVIALALMATARYW